MRPPDLARHELASSNSTANAFLGGRVPSWMTSSKPQPTVPPPAPSRKRPAPKELAQPRRLSKPAINRPSSSASPVLSCVPAPAPQPANAAVQNASNPASPALPNVVTSLTSQSSADNENNILPSPAPSEDLSAGRGRAATIISLGEGEDDEDNEYSGVDHTRTADTTSAERRSASSGPLEGRLNSTSSKAMPAPVERPSRDAEQVYRIEDRAHPANPRPVSPQDLGNGTQMQTITPATSDNPAMSPRDSARWSTLPPPGASCYDPDFCLRELQHLRDISDDGKSLNGVENVRIELMREAVEIKDHDYMRFHQLMCLQVLSPDRLPLEFSTIAATTGSLDLLNHLVQTRECSKAWLQWFADFPVTLQHLKQRWPDEYDRQTLHIKQFLALAVAGWEKLQKACFEKKLPPTAVEIRRELGMNSNIFQSVFNRAILRAMCNFPEPNTESQINFISQAEAAFKDHQYRLQSHTAVPTTQELNIVEMNEERLYRDRIISLQQYFLSGARRQEASTLQSRRMSRQAQTAQERQINSPVHRSHPNSPVQHAPLGSPAYQNQGHAPLQHQIMPAQQPGRPQVQISIPQDHSNGSQMVHLGTMPPVAILPSSQAAPAQSINRQTYYVNNQQSFHQGVPVGSPMIGPPNCFAVPSNGHSPVSQNWVRMQPQFPMSPPYPSPGTQPYHGAAIRHGVPNGVQQQPPYQHILPGPVDPRSSHPQMYNQQILRSNSAPSLAAVQAAHRASHQAQPVQANGQPGPPAHMQQRQRQQSQPFIPRSGHIWQPQAIDPSQSALHQAHLRSPVLRAWPHPEVGEKLYQSVVAFAIPPTRLADFKPQQAFSFRVSPEEKNALPAKTPASLGKPSTRFVNEESRIYRLRCARSSVTEEHDWILQDTLWPAGMVLSLNGDMLEMRKKLQHGKDHPIDITSLIRLDENQLEISLLRRPNEEKTSNFVIAVEVIGIQHYEKIKVDCTLRKLIPAEDVLDSIKNSLNGPEDDDDIAIVDSNVTINLFDPFTNCRPCDIPVRGKHCLHRNCFDLEIFLQTRDRRQDSPCYVDVWKCPICRADVRPKSLVVDGFLIDVHKKLSAMGQSNTRAIIVDSDGKWRPKPEDKQDDSRTSHSSTPVDNSKAPPAPTPSSHLPSEPPEVIELE